MIRSQKNEYKKISCDKWDHTLHADQLQISGFKNNIWKKWMFYIINLPLFGTAILILKWYPQFIYMKCTKASLENADLVLVKDLCSRHSIHSVHTVRIKTSDTQLTLQNSLHSVLKKDHFRYFIHKNLRYVWLSEEMQFFQLKGLCVPKKKKIRELLNESSGYSREEQKLLLTIYGKNEIKIILQSSWELFKNEITSPFYIFQVFAIILWVVNDYLSYALCVIALCSWAIFITLNTTQKQQLALQSLVKKSTARNVSVVRKNGDIEKIDPSYLVPGDIVYIPPNGCLMPCDALLLHGNCIVNESTLTGENCPVIKTPPINTEEILNPIIFKNHILFCGTQILQTRYYGDEMVTAVIVNTGFSTIKGDLVRSLLHPKPVGFRFYEDSIKFIFYLFIAATCGISYLIYISLLRKMSIKALILDSLDLITIVVPPSLPAALNTGIAYSKSRLHSKGINCISPAKINVFGKLKLMCFDKTGTLTEEGLNLWGIMPCGESKFGAMIKTPLVLDTKHPIVIAFASCHSLTKINGKLSGNVVDLTMFNTLNWELIEPGKDNYRYDMLCPVIVKPKFYIGSKSTLKKDSIYTNESQEMKHDSEIESNKTEKNDNCFENLNLDKIEETELPYEIGIVREFPFTSSSKCISVITRELGMAHMNLFCKGAPERVFELCIPSSLPRDFGDQLQIYASMGLRVLGLAYKQFDPKFTWRKSQRVCREEVERDLIFLALIIIQNNLKKISTSVINDLTASNIRCVMMTGDNILTAISVSRECMMILPEDEIIEVKVLFSNEHEKSPTLSFQPFETTSYGQYELLKPSLDSNSSTVYLRQYHFVMTGKTWELLNAHFSDLIPNIIVKGVVFARMLPEQKIQLIEAFQDLDYIVGMCGNGANDFGAMKAAHVGVSLSECNNSVIAPFTSKIQNISCIITLVQEGRCALVSTFVIFKYMTTYGLIQFISVLIAYSKGVTFSNMEFLYVDFIVTSLLALVIGKTGPSKDLAKERPIARLICFENLLPLILHVLVLFFIQICVLEFINEQKWFVPVVPGPETVTTCWENSVIYCTSLFQYLILALVYSKGTPHRQPFYKNVLFVIIQTLMTLFAIILCIYPFQYLAYLFEIIPVENDNRKQLLFRIKLLMFPLLNLLLAFLIEAFMVNKKWLKKIIHFVNRKKTSKNRYKRILQNPDCQIR